MATLKNTIVNDTGYFQLPNGTTAQRPVSPSAGMTRWNTTNAQAEIWDGTAWFPMSSAVPPNIDYLVVAGGAAGGGYGGNDGAGGGGAGGLVYNTQYAISTGTTYTIVVGSGGASATSQGSMGGNGTNSSFTTITPLEASKKKCTELGFKPATELHGKCVLQLSK